MYRSLLADFAPVMVRRRTRQQCRDGFLLVRDDNEEHIRHHDRPNECADLVEGSPPTEHMRKEISQDNEEDISGKRKYHLVAPKRGTAKALVGKPSHGQGR